MLVALALSVAAYTTFGIVASKLWPRLDARNVREVEVQLLPSASATPLGLSPVELAAPPRVAAGARPVVPPRSADMQRAPAPVVNAPPVMDAPPVVNAPPVTNAPPVADAVSNSAGPPLSERGPSRSGAAGGSVAVELASASNTEIVVPFGPGMTPPRRVSGEAPKYTTQALAARIEGRVIVRCVLGTTGDVRSCRIVKPLAELDRAAVRALEASRFTPVTFQGRPAAVTYLFTFDFRLP
jgi:protein TonB